MATRTSPAESALRLLRRAYRNHDASGGTKPLLVGELNPHNRAAALALFPRPEGSAVWRLCHLILQMDPVTYLDRFDRANLCSGDWDPERARSEADALVSLRTGRDFILLGARVA